MPSWWDDLDPSGGGNALRYYLGPAYEPIQSGANFLASMSPGADMMDMHDQSDALMHSQGGWDAVNHIAGLGAATLGMAIPGTAKGISEGVDEAAKGIRAYHGSPHDFDRFSMDKIGTGEGAQAYGHGLYFADNEDVARSYRNSLAMPAGDPMARMAAKLEEAGSDVGAGLRRMFPRITDDEITATLDKIHNPSWGKMYEVNINAHPDDFLDWDKPLSEQSEKVRRGLGWTPELEAQAKAAQDADTDGLLAALSGDAPYSETKFALPPGVPSYHATGADLVKGSSIFDSAADPGRAARLRAAGIPGIRYLDQGSRTAGDVNDLRGTLSMWEKALTKTPNDAFAQQQVADARAKLAQADAGLSRNYVVFDDNLISIMRKYGLLGAAGLAGANYLAPMAGEPGQGPS